MISVKEYKPELFGKVLEFCRTQKDDSEASLNMWTKDWKQNPSTLPYILKTNERFSNDQGMFHLLYDDEIIIGCGGVYISDFSSQVAIAGSRTWIDKKYRNLQYIKNYILVENKTWAVKRSIDVIALSFNFYNQNLIKLFTIGMKLGTRTERHIFYNNFNKLEYPVIIRNTPQWVIYENLSDYRYDWEQLKVEVKDELRPINTA
jgi:hypothetical protein